jgi:hypothetical protein
MLIVSPDAINLPTPKPGTHPHKLKRNPKAKTRTKTKMKMNLKPAKKQQSNSTGSQKHPPDSVAKVLSQVKVIRDW